MKALDVTSIVLVIVGGLNWGLVGAFDFNLVSALFGDGALARTVYGLVGLSALYQAVAAWSVAQRWAPARSHATATADARLESRRHVA